MNIVLMTKNKPISRLVYQWCKDVGRFSRICLVSEDDLHPSSINERQFIERINRGPHCFWKPDLIVSFLYPKIIKEPILSCATLGCINLHPAPLPEYKGVAPYTRGILNGARNWGVSAHYIDVGIDTGDLIKVKEFEISDQETAVSLATRSHYELFELLKDVMNMFKSGKVPKSPQNGGTYFSMKDFEKIREIKDSDSDEMIERKTRAFWHPPHEGAYMMVKDTKVLAIPRCALSRRIG